MVEEVKILLGDSANSFTQEQIEVCCKWAIAEVEAYTGRTIANDYELEWKKPIANGIFQNGVGVFNGDIGYITQINKQTLEVVVEFEDGRIVTYSTTDLSELVLSYAITIHKAQRKRI